MGATAIPIDAPTMKNRINSTFITNFKDSGLETCMEFLMPYNLAMLRQVIEKREICDPMVLMIPNIEQ
jgi:hypothetical protein